MSKLLEVEGLNLLFRDARTHSIWLDKPVDEAVLREIYQLTKFAPTSANSQPMRVVFVTSADAKARLNPALAPQNIEKTMTAPVTAIIAHDLEFYEHLPRLYPQTDARSWFVGKPDHILTSAFRNGSIEGGYFILAARALGLDCGPMSGFDNAKVDAAFFPDGKWKSNFLCNIGYGDRTKLHARNPRLDFSEACRFE